jgi:hypothetical protein
VARLPVLQHPEDRKKLALGGARPTVSWGIDHFAHWPHVKDLAPHHSPNSSGACRRCGSIAEAIAAPPTPNGRTTA